MSDARFIHVPTPGGSAKGIRIRDIDHIFVDTDGATRIVTRTSAGTLMVPRLTADEIVERINQTISGKTDG